MIAAKQKGNGACVHRFRNCIYDARIICRGINIQKRNISAVYQRDVGSNFKAGLGRQVTPVTE